jgi:hypothetical protein
MLILWNALALELYLLPLTVVFIARAQAGREGWRAALDLCCVVSLDLLSVLLLARLLTLEIATLVSRALWLVLGGLWIYSRRSSIRGWLRQVEFRGWIAPLVCAAASVWLSTLISLPCNIWDRQWHIPLVGSMRGQHAPFFNLYEPGGALYYHYAGDAFAAMYQSLSFAHVQAASAIARSHDLLFGLFGLAMAGILPAFGLNRLVWSLIATCASLLGGPLTLVLSGNARPELGRSVINLLSLSYRPHTPLAYLLILGFAGALLLPVVSRGQVPARAGRVCLFSCTAALVLTDETSLALLGVLLGVIWLLHAPALAESRKHGFLVGLGLLATIAGVIFCYGGSFTFGAAQPASVALLPDYRVPGFYQDSIPLASSKGVAALLTDLWAIAAVCLAGLLAAFTTRQRPVVVLWLGYAVMSAVGVLALTRLQVNGGSTECHRFATVSLFLAPLFGMSFAAVHGLAWTFETSRSLVALITGIGIGLPAMSTAEWALGLFPPRCLAEGHKTYTEVDCRSFAGARSGDKAIIAYVDAHAWYEFAGCRPVRAPSDQQDKGGHQTFTGGQASGWQGVRMLDGWLNDKPLTMFCTADSQDGVCARVRRTPGACRPEAGSFQRCTMSSELRKQLIGKHR